MQSLRSMARGVATVRAATQAFSQQVAPAMQSRARTIRKAIEHLKGNGQGAQRSAGAGAAVKFQRRVPPYRGGPD